MSKVKDEIVVSSKSLKGLKIEAVIIKESFELKFKIEICSLQILDTLDLFAVVSSTVEC